MRDVMFGTFCRIINRHDMRQDFLTSSFLELRAKLHRMAMRLLSSNEEAQDALQDAYLRLRAGAQMQSAAEADHKLVVVLRNLCIDRLRKQREISLESNEVLQLAREDAQADEFARELEAVLQAELTELQRRIFNMVTHEEIEYEMIAERLGMSVEAVRMNMSRARKRMRETYIKLNR